MALVQTDHTFLMLHLCIIQCWIFFFTCINVPCCLSSACLLNIEEEKYWSLYVEKEEKFSLHQYVPVEMHFVFTFYCLFFLEKCVSKASSAAELPAASLLRAADVLSKVP